MFGIGTGELILIIVIAMLVIGPERTVEFTRRGGQLLAKLRSQTDQVTKEFREALANESDELSDLKDANPLTAINELREEANAAARDFQNVLSGKPVTSDRQTKAAATPKQQAEPASQTPTDGTDADAAHAGDIESRAEEAALAAEIAAVEAVDEGAFAEGLELGGPVLVESEVEEAAAPADALAEGDEAATTAQAEGQL